MHGIIVHPRALDHKSLYKGCEGEIPHFFMVFLSLLLSFSLSPLILAGGGRVVGDDSDAAASRR